MSKRANGLPIVGASIIQAFKDADIRTVVALPDIVTCETVLWPISSDSSFKFVPVCKEDEGVSICAGLSYCEHRAVLLMQHTGFLDSINAIRAIAVEYQLPIVMVVGLQGMEAGISMYESASVGIRMLQPTCDAMGLKHIEMAIEDDAASISELIGSAYKNLDPIVIFLPVSPV